MIKSETPAAGESLTVLEQSVRRLRNAIMLGQLHPGRKLIEADLCRDMQISRPSLREALRILEAERLIEIIPNRGPSVAKLGPQEIEQIHDVWSLLTSEAMARFAGRVTEEDIQEIRKFLATLVAALETENSLDQLAAINVLFRYIHIRCGNEVLNEVVFSLVSRLNFLRAQSLRYEGWRFLCAQEIKEIIAAIETRDQDTARAATHRHINSACAAAKHVALLPQNAATKSKAGSIPPLASSG